MLDDPMWVYRFLVENPPALMLAVTITAMFAPKN